MGTAYFRILGSLEVCRDNAVIALSAAKHRIILASLLVEPGQVVPLNTLVDRLWEDAPPVGARAAVQTYVARLRRALGPPGYLQTRNNGYVIDLPPGSSDIQDFNDLLETARSAAGRGERESALAALRSANALWRGPILFDVESAALHRDVVPHLLERCLTAAVRRFELELVLGNHRGIVEELRLLTVAHPLQEGLRALLMRALYRSGRQAEALEVYRDTDALLRSQVGLDPGHELRSLQQAILRGDPDEPDDAARDGAANDAEVVEVAEPPVEPAPYQVLCQLPPAIGDFVGRSEQLARLEHHLVEDTGEQLVPIAVVSGVAGVGKSTLVIRVAHRLRPRFPDGQLYVNLGGACAGARDPADVLGDLLPALGHQSTALPIGLAARSAAFRARVADRRVLIVLDDAADAAQVLPLLPGTPGAAVLVTSRHSLGELAATHRHRLQPFSVDEAVSLLGRIVERERVADEPAAAREIVALCGHLPLAVRVVGARLQPQPTVRLSTLLDRLRDDHRRLDELSVGRLEVRSELEFAYSGLTGHTQVAFRRIGFLPSGSFSAWALGALTDGGDGERVVERLVAAGLLEPVGVDAADQPRYRPHDLVALFARELAAREDVTARRTAVKRLLDTYLVLGRDVYGRARRVNEGLPADELPADLAPAAIDVAALTKEPDTWVHTERDGLLHAIEQACRLGWYREAALLADLVVPILAVRGQFEQLQHSRALVRDAAFAVGDELVACRAETSRGDILLSRRVDEAGAAFERCVPVFRRMGLHHELVHSLTGLAFARMMQSLPASEYAEEAVRIACAAGDADGLVLALRTHAETLITDEHPDKALPLLEKALPITRARQNSDGRRAILMRILLCATLLGDLDRAEESYAEALTLTDAISDPIGIAWLLLHHSRVRSARGDEKGAIAEAERACGMLARAGDIRGFAAASLRLAEAQVQAGEYAAAIAQLQETLATFDEGNTLFKTRAKLLLDRAMEANSARARPAG
jgi:DNA-binding SARP family transcriptional activator/tetratricopeptide (TPR) repeat protein